MENAYKRNINVLIVEDNPGDARLIEEVFKQNKIYSSFIILNDGVKAINYLKKQDEYINAMKPDVIILDLNLPKKDGREVLSEIKFDELLMHIPVIVLTSSSSEEDILNAYNLHANCYVTKPIDFNSFTNAIKSIENYWFSVVKLPGKNNT
jgi:CheY-like chemotaxis protein